MKRSSDLTTQLNESKVKDEGKLNSLVEKINSSLGHFNTMLEKLYDNIMQEVSTKNEQQVVVNNPSPLNNLAHLEHNEEKGKEEAHSSPLTSHGLAMVAEKIEVLEGSKEESYVEGLVSPDDAPRMFSKEQGGPLAPTYPVVIQIQLRKHYGGRRYCEFQGRYATMRKTQHLTLALLDKLKLRRYFARGVVSESSPEALL
ncbi:uncharacterized protein G2W53_000962 [Senna tora]|uniref:Uncharacterized protein n=1 Tax=Senna tora TaxID=362788 RepID=A0A834XGW3_9FABA|nr:uncharacterized protein G2W53_000962 [Senna tora]